MEADRKIQDRFLWQKTKEGTARLLRVYGGTPEVVLPERIAGVPLTEIGAYCFAESPHLPEGEIFDTDAEKQAELRELCGAYIESIRLPDCVTKVGNLAFYNCLQLREIFIGKNLTEVGSDAFMNCRNLKELKLSGGISEKSGLKQILSQISSDLEVVFYQGDVIDAKVFYPEYQEFYDEIAPAHIFGRNIEGEGFRARQSFREGVADLAQYDLIFPRACVEENEQTLLKLAADRLCYPVDLKEAAKELYEDYMKVHGKKMAHDLVLKKDLDMLSFLCKKKYLKERELEEIIAFSAEAEWAEGTASLLKWKREFFKEQEKERYSFDDF